MGLTDLRTKIKYSAKATDGQLITKQKRNKEKKQRQITIKLYTKKGEERRKRRMNWILREDTEINGDGMVNERGRDR